MPKLERCDAHGALFTTSLSTCGPIRRLLPQWLSLELNAENRRILYVPEGFAHGFQTLEDATEVFYEVSVFYAPEYVRGVRWDDPAFGIQWPPAHRTISIRDRTHPDFIVPTLIADAVTNNR